MVKPTDHVSKSYGQVPKNVTKMFGFNKTLIDNAFKGDTAALEKIAQMGQAGQRISLLSPAIQERLNQHIQGTVDYNTTLSNLLQQGAKGYITIRGQQYAGLMTDQRFGNQLDELHRKYQIDSHTEQVRHEQSNELMVLAAWVAQNIGQIDFQFQKDKTTARVEVKQIQTDRDYIDTQAQHILANGTTKGLPPKRSYTGFSAIGSFIQRVLS